MRPVANSRCASAITGSCAATKRVEPVGFGHFND
jgi:hypothetical protein